MGISELSRPLSAAERPCIRSRWFYLSVKRLMDVLISLLALAALAPLLLAIAIAIKLDSPGPVIFCQKRVRGGQSPDEPHPERKVFDFYKFRSMYVNCDSAAHRRYVTALINGHAQQNHCAGRRPVYKIADDPRITRVGRFIRRTSLDELPQLFNVLKGDMSLVGPRPALPYEVEQYAHGHKARLIPQAGLTGLWQVSGRTCLSFDEMVQLDIEYGQRCSLGLDLMILFKTLPAVLSADGAW